MKILYIMDLLRHRHEMVTLSNNQLLMSILAENSNITEF